jgi:hypothetical protein
MSGPTADDFRAKVFRDREHPGDWRVEKLCDEVNRSRLRSSAAAMSDNVPFGMPIANTASLTRSSWSATRRRPSGQNLTLSTLT